MKVLLAASAGFCWGVERAVTKARQMARDTGRPVHTDGPLIHNEQMMAQLASEGVRECADPARLSDTVLMIRAHGVPPRRRAALRRLPVHLVDATCPDVAKIQGLIKTHAARGESIIIYGDAGHAEVIGLQGFAGERGFVVQNEADVDKLPPLQRVCLVAQSTQLPVSYERVAAAVKRRFSDAIVLATICASTRRRQQDLTEMAAHADSIVVVGGRHSANTMRLVELATSLRPTHHIQTAAQLKPAWFRSGKTVALTAGASTPAFIIREVKQTLEKLGRVSRRRATGKTPR